MIVGATGESDRHILTLTQSLYDTYHPSSVFSTRPMCRWWKIRSYRLWIPSRLFCASTDSIRRIGCCGSMASAPASCSTKPAGLRSAARSQVLLGAAAPRLLPGRGQPRGLRSAAARSRHRRGQREAHPCRAPRRGAARRGPQKARRRAQAGAVFSHLLRPKHRTAAALARGGPAQSDRHGACLAPGGTARPALTL